MLLKIRFLSLFLAGLMACSAGVVATFAQSGQPQLDTDPVFKPLMDTSRQHPDGGEKTLEGSVEKQGEIPVNTGERPRILQGGVQTLQQAIELETDIDWYTWYLTAREYLSRTGGLQCPLGTSIKFHKTGKIEAMTPDAICMASVAGRNFPLPKKTRLSALILPFRNGNAPPATPDELYSRINALKRIK